MTIGWNPSNYWNQASFPLMGGWNSTNSWNNFSFPMMGGYSTMPFMMGGFAPQGNSEFNDKIRNLTWDGGQISKESMTELFEMMGEKIKSMCPSPSSSSDGNDSPFGSTGDGVTGGGSSSETAPKVFTPEFSQDDKDDIAGLRAGIIKERDALIKEKKDENADKIRELKRVLNAIDYLKTSKSVSVKNAESIEKQINEAKAKIYEYRQGFKNPNDGQTAAFDALLGAFGEKYNPDAKPIEPTAGAEKSTKKPTLFDSVRNQAKRNQEVIEKFDVQNGILTVKEDGDYLGKTREQMTSEWKEIKQNFDSLKAIMGNKDEIEIGGTTVTKDMFKKALQAAEMKYAEQVSSRLLGTIDDSGKENTEVKQKRNIQNWSSEEVRAFLLSGDFHQACDDTHMNDGWFSGNKKAYNALVSKFCEVVKGINYGNYKDDINEENLNAIRAAFKLQEGIEK